MLVPAGTRALRHARRHPPDLEIELNFGRGGQDPVPRFVEVFTREEPPQKILPTLSSSSFLFSGAERAADSFKTVKLSEPPRSRRIK